MSPTAAQTTLPEAHRSAVIAVLALAEGPMSLDRIAQVSGLEETATLRTLARLLAEDWVETVSLESFCESCRQSLGKRTRYQLCEERRQ